MLKGFRGVPLAMVAWNLVLGVSGASGAAASQPEAEQVVSAQMKKLYMAAAAETPQSAAQQKVILQMAEKAANGKELLLVMRAAAGAFPPKTGSGESSTENQVISMVTAKMTERGTLDQLMDYAKQYPVNPENARPFVQRMMQVADKSADSRVWYRIRVIASRLKVDDLERQAQARGDQLARK